ncbi:MAG: hypothetical protein RJQ09_15895 [Cyclobacteriaceae bacterium]
MSKSTRNLMEVFFKDVQALVTISYLLMVGIGMLFNHQKYAEFGINIFQYADVFDFLIAPFEDYVIILLALGSTLIPFVLYRLDDYFKLKFPKFYSIISFKLDQFAWFDRTRYVGFAVLVVFYVFLAADRFGDLSKTRINESGNVQLRFADNEIITGRLIGKTQETMFLLIEDKVKIVPLTSLVKDIEMP